jgi:protein gp37
LRDEDGYEKYTKNGIFGGRIETHPERLSIPLKRRKPTVYAVWNDLFHEAVPIQFRVDTCSTMLGCNRHTYLILTKRPNEMLRYFKENTLSGYAGRDHIWHGLTICNQQEADEKIPVFRKVPGKKFLSIEPMLGPINLGINLFKMGNLGTEDDGGHRMAPDNIDAVILGGETGPGARPMHPDWLRSVRDQCSAAGVTFFFKSWGKHIPDLFDVFGDVGKDVPIIDVLITSRQHRKLDGRTHDELPWRDA